MPNKKHLQLGVADPSLVHVFILQSTCMYPIKRKGYPDEKKRGGIA